MMRAIVIAALLLCGCASAPVQLQPFEVKVPVMVPCSITPPAEPEYSGSKITAQTNIFDSVKFLLAEIEERKGYTKLLLASNAGCLQQPPTTATKGGAQ